jgi:pyridoxal phosphate enzyme (YggS family)
MSTHCLENFRKIYNIVQKLSNQKKINIIAVSKTFSLDEIYPLINSGHLHYGENRVSEAISKWSNLLKINNEIKLHMLGHLQTNKVKEALSIFSYIHSLDSERLAIALSKEEKISGNKIKYFIQVNFDNEKQKSGISLDVVDDFVKYTRNVLDLNVIGLMCIPPINNNPNQYFLSLKKIADKNKFFELSMGMSNDYQDAIHSGSTFIRVCSAIFGNRK